SAVINRAAQLPVVRIKPSVRPPEYDPAEYGAQMVVFDSALSYHLGITTSDDGVKVIGVNYPTAFENAFWIYPLFVLGVPVTMVFDIVTFPVQFEIARRHPDSIWPP